MSNTLEVRNVEQDELEGMLTMPEVAERMGVHLNTVRNWIQKGYLPVIKWGPRFVRVHEDDLAQFIKGENNGRS